MTRLAEHISPRITAPVLTDRALKVTVLSGGPSAEREVSLKSGRAVAEALQSLGHHVHLADIAPESLEALDVPADVVFIALHGAFGEDGQVQRILEQRGQTYCGCGPAASALAMDKAAAKCRFIEAEVPTPAFEVVTSSRLDKVLAAWSPPAVVKPVDEGSSVGCRLIQQADDLTQFCGELVSEHGRCLIEQYIRGIELTVGVLGGEALPPIQIRTRRAFYDYQAKYIDNDTEYLFDIDLPMAVLAEIQQLSIKAFEALGCCDFGRVDWMVDGSTHQPYALEVNTIPGFTDHSLLPKAAAEAGLSFPQLCQRILELALQRDHPSR